MSTVGKISPRTSSDEGIVFRYTFVDRSEVSMCSVWL